MSKQVQNFIDDARRFQRCSDHDLAISSLQLAQQEDHHKEHEIEIQKLFSLTRKDVNGLEVLQRENVRVERVIDLSDAEIESLMNQ